MKVIATRNLAFSFVGGFVRVGVHFTMSSEELQLLASAVETRPKPSRSVA